METVKLPQEQIEDLMEVGNIGAGNAASGLSDLIHHRCVIDIPMVSYVNTEGIKKVLEMEDSFVVTLHIKIMGDIPALMFVVMKRIYAQTIVKYMTREGIEAVGRNFNFTAQFALKQLGELLTKSFFDAINQLLMTKAKYAMPEIIMDNWTSAVDAIIKLVGNSNKEVEHLFIHSSFFDPEKTFEGKFVYVLNIESQKIILNRLRMLLNR